METTLPLPFLASVDLGKGPAEAKEGLTRTQLSYLGSVYFSASPKTVDSLLQFLQKHVSIEAYVNVTSIESIEDLISILDAGARKIFVKPGQLQSLATYGDRVLPAIHIQDFTAEAYANGILIDVGEDQSTFRSVVDKLAANKTSPIFLTSTLPFLEEFLELAKKIFAIPILPAAQLTVEKGSAGQGSIPAIIGRSWTSDRADKLIPTIVTDERGIALGLVYSSQESLAESLKTGTGVYQSRKRGLWYKGATSGDIQELVRVSLDCDQDCLKFVVRQKGRGMYNLYGKTCNIF